jgi:hypothetical protein
MTLLRFVVAVFYSLVGVSGGIAFMILKNYPAAILAVTTGNIYSFTNCQLDNFEEVDK